MAPPDSETSPIVDSSAALASLYQAPLSEFVARRAALATQLKRSGHKDVASRIAAAGKPSRAAYLVNQVYWRQRELYDGVLAAGTAARAAQQARLLGDPGDLAQTMQVRDAAVRTAVHAAEGIAAREGQAASEATTAQVRGTFEALAAHGLEGRLPHGHLDADVALPGLGALAGLTLPAASAMPPIRRFEVVARRTDVDAAPTPPPPDPRVVEAEDAVAALAQRHAAASERLDELRRTTAAAHEVAAATERAAADAERAARDARQAAVRAERSTALAEQDALGLTSDLEEARARLRQLTATPEPPPPASPPSQTTPVSRTRRKKRGG